jgi:hypothetical protein
MQQQQQPPPPFNPNDHQWYPGQPKISVEEFHQMLLRPGNLVEFFERHPHFIPFLAFNVEKLFGGVLDAKLVKALVLTMRFQTQVWRQQFPDQQSTVSAIDTAWTQAENAQPSVAQELDLKSDHFLSQLTDVEIAQIEALHVANHNLAQKTGYVEYNHPDPNQATAYNTPWGVTYQQQNGDWNLQHHQQPPYQTQNNGYSNQPPNGMGDPWGHPQQPGQPPQPQSGNLTGTLISAGIGYLMPQQQQAPPPWAPPPPQQQYW